ncbi:hypothetical protein [Streptomyces californicus]|uniref:hypothetical protein n=1 Tax=Streptomyces californicus TaxID=67351 RepID=UPI0037936365
MGDLPQLGGTETVDVVEDHGHRCAGQVLVDRAQEVETGGMRQSGALFGIKIPARQFTGEAASDGVCGKCGRVEVGEGLGTVLGGVGRPGGLPCSGETGDQAHPVGSGA